MEKIGSIGDIQTLVRQGFTDWKEYGEVVVQAKNDLLLFNYTTAAQYQGRWNFFERASRGLIIHAKTGEIIARPFDKFFNWFENGRRARGHIVAVTEKIDGSLGILYRDDGYKIATRGSFESVQAQWATQFLNENYDLADLPDELTLLFEIVYPDNRIVVNYGDREDLILLAARNRHTGQYLPFFPNVYLMGEQYGFTLPEVYQFNDVMQLLELTGQIEADEEGYVVEFSDDSRFKFKGDRYLELQKLITGLTFKNTLKAMENNSLDDILNTVPDEFLNQVKIWISEIETTVADIRQRTEQAFALAPKDTRKDFALWVNEHYHDLSRYLFALLDEEDLVPLIYKYHEWKETVE